MQEEEGRGRVEIQERNKETGPEIADLTNQIKKRIEQNISQTIIQACLCFLLESHPEEGIVGS